MSKTIIQTELSVKDIYRVVAQNIPQKFIGRNVKGRPFFGFIYILDGKTEYTFDECSFTVKPGDILFLPKDSIYSMNILTPFYKVVFVDFDFNIPDNESLSTTGCIFKSNIGTETAFQKLLKRWLFKSHAWKTSCMAMLYEIYASIILDNSHDYVPLSKQKKLEPALKIIVQYHTTQNITIAQLAEVCGMSETHFRRLFKEVYHISPAQYITKLRINYAKDLMKYENASIQQVSEALGFSSVYHFSKVFKRETDFSPSEYKKTLASKL
ncbi:MAG: AraC family transcriptional regulator [Clostridiales bacterium]|nr:AraC family transcriptional regulator [Clostridiales bacterium]